jgi:hypothetical protein
MPASISLQTKSGGASKGLATKEFSFKAKSLIGKLKKKLTTSGKYKKKLMRVFYDKAKFHPPTVEALGVKGALLHVLPTNSPDMNKVVEHAHARVKKTFADLWAANPELITREQGVALLRRVLNDPETFSGIKKDFLTMKQTYKAVITAKGGWPPSKFR